MYQFLVSTTGYTNNAVFDLTDKDGNKTGHLVGLLSRTMAYHEAGIKPVWVFDGKPPTMKSGEVQNSAITLKKIASQKKATQKTG